MALAERMRSKNMGDLLDDELLYSVGKRTNVDVLVNLLTESGRQDAETTLASVPSKETGTAKAGEMKDAVNRARGERKNCFVDGRVSMKVHRYNKSQQDGTITLIGATTENSSFEVINALLSRCHVLHSHESIEESFDVQCVVLLLVVQSLTQTQEKSNGDASSVGKDSKEASIKADDEAIDYLAKQCAGDVRCVAVMKKNATLYWSARMLEGGENPLYVTRRLVRIASEDVSLAAPDLLPMAVLAYQAGHFVGMPECDVVLAHVATMLARAPKSVKVYAAYKRAKQTIDEWDKGALPDVPFISVTP
ncbi:unnamed protein product [Peronospora destructor]|nr:unnamed protein product [Peronospora destructor]